jgi:tetratricopeptide (TPR) repeat protein
LAESRGLQAQAIKHYEMAITVDPLFVGPRANLADLLERRAAQSANAGPLNALVERLRKEELPLVERNARLLPQNAELQYRYALALYLNGQLDQASERAVKAAELAPEQAEYAQMAALLFESTKQFDEAIRWGEETSRRSGNSPESKALLERIKAAAGTR